jgi:glycerophosphoryl diester phosphodiesterase
LVATNDLGTQPEFAALKSTAIVDGVTEVGFFASDFALSEVKKLRAVQDFADRSQELTVCSKSPRFLMRWPPRYSTKF